MKHILFTLKGCIPEELNDEGLIRDVMYQASKWSRSTLISLHSHKFAPQGVTAIALLAESHISIHTWPEKGIAICDVFTCGHYTKPMDAVKYMKAEFNAANIIVNEFERPLE